MKRFIVYDTTTGAVLRGGTCQDGDLALQVLDRPGEAVMEAPPNVALYAEVNLAPVREYVKSQIDASADAFCLQFVTPGTTQAMRYQQKLAEAKAWVPGANIDDFAMLKAECLATGQQVEDLVSSVLAKAAEWLYIGAAVEGARMAAKASVDAAQTVAEIHQASQVNWNALIPTP